MPKYLIIGEKIVQVTEDSWRVRPITMIIDEDTTLKTIVGWWRTQVGPEKLHIVITTIDSEVGNDTKK